ncbi:GNAT family N-acetyltransferase [Ornithinibacillus sp. 4-3]|uniref:GNAT family N-acetyltransferase n=1 Tax=Ornithinibacillus sp. 4-3 TaxID=3231488 RepID=A0AB39HKU2_9BACI
MLIIYKKNFEKIAMGLLSFMPAEKKDVKLLQHTMKEYETNSDWHLYLWKEEDILGAIGLKIVDGEVIIQHISVNPSHRNMGIGKKMLNEIKRQYEENYTISAAELVKNYVEACFNGKKQDAE